MKTSTFTTVVVAFLIGVTACGVVPQVLVDQAALPASPTPTPQPTPAEPGGQDMMVTPPPPVASVTPAIIDQGPPAASSAEAPKPGEMIVYEETMPLITTTVGTAMAPQEIERPSRGHPKLESSLNQLLEAYHRGGLAEAQAFATMHMMVIEGDRVQVEVMATEEAAIPGLKETVETVGGEYQGHYKTLLQALIPIDDLESLAERPGVQVVRLPQRAVAP
jgi:hypothetical protein